MMAPESQPRSRSRTRWQGVACVAAALILLIAGCSLLAVACSLPRPLIAGPVAFLGPSAVGTVRLSNVTVAITPAARPGTTQRWRARYSTLDLDPRSYSPSRFRLVNKRFFRLGGFILMEL